MKKLGLLGGMGPESTLLYYKEIASRFQQREANGQFPALSIETVNMYEMLGYCMAGAYEALADYLLQAVKSLEASGAQFIAMASNTPHIVFESLQEQASVPLLSIVTPTCEAVCAANHRKIAWLGTAFTMQEPYFKQEFIQNGIEVVVPNEAERGYIDAVIATELEFGVVKETSRERIDKIIDRLIATESIDAVVLGCTELPLMYAKDTLPVPAYDTLQYHIDAIVNHMLS